MPLHLLARIAPPKEHPPEAEPLLGWHREPDSSGELRGLHPIRADFLEQLRAGTGASALRAMPRGALRDWLRSPQQHTLVAALMAHPEGARIARRAALDHRTLESRWLRDTVAGNLQALESLPAATAAQLRQGLLQGDPEAVPADPYGLKALPPLRAPHVPEPAGYPSFFAMNDMSEGARFGAAVGAGVPPPGPIPRLMHAIWLGGLLPGRYHARLASFRKHNPEHTYVLWTDWSRADLDASPAGQRLLAFCLTQRVRLASVANLALPLLQQQGLAPAYQKAVLHRQYGAASDVLRIGLLHAFGGLYADADRSCERPLLPLHQHRLVLYGDHHSPICNDFLMSAPRHPFLRQLSQAIIEAHPHAARPWGRYARAHAAVLETTGPALLQREGVRWSPDRHRENLRLLDRERLGSERGPLSYSVRRNDLTWLTPPTETPADGAETPERRLQRQTTCVLDGWRDLADLTLGLPAGRRERRAVLAEAAKYLLAGG